MLFVVGGTQTRSVQCQRTDAKGNKKIVSDVHCTGSGLSKPISSQACNTHACVDVANDSFSTVQDSQIVILNSDLLSNEITLCLCDNIADIIPVPHPISNITLSSAYLDIKSIDSLQGTPHPYTSLII